MMPELTAATASDFIDCTIADKAVPKPTAAQLDKDGNGGFPKLGVPFWGSL